MPGYASIYNVYIQFRELNHRLISVRTAKSVCLPSATRANEIPNTRCANLREFSALLTPV